MPHPTASLTGEKRDAVYGFLVEHLGALGDVRTAIDRGGNSIRPGGSPGSSPRTSACWTTSAGVPTSARRFR